MSSVQPYRGASAFAAMSNKFPMQRYLRMMDGVEKPIMPVLWGTFGKSTNGIKAFTDKFNNEDHAVQIHFSNEVSRRNGNMRQGDFMRGASVNDYNRMLERGNENVKQKVFNRVAKIAKRLGVHKEHRKSWADDALSPNTKFLMSTGLESNYTNKANKRLTRWIKAAWKQASDIPMSIVRNPVRNQSVGGGKHLELHGTNPAFGGRRDNAIANLDGVSVNVGDGEQYHEQISVRQAEQYVDRNDDTFATILWSAKQQGLDGATGWGGQGVPAPRDRNFRITERAIEAFNRLLKR